MVFAWFKAMMYRKTWIWIKKKARCSKAFNLKMGRSGKKKKTFEGQTWLVTCHASWTLLHFVPFKQPLCQIVETSLFDDVSVSCIIFDITSIPTWWWQSRHFFSLGTLITNIVPKSMFRMLGFSKIFVAEWNTWCEVRYTVPWGKRKQGSLRRST